MFDNVGERLGVRSHRMRLGSSSCSRSAQDSLQPAERGSAVGRRRTAIRTRPEGVCGGRPSLQPLQHVLPEHAITTESFSGCGVVAGGGLATEVVGLPPILRRPVRASDGLSGPVGGSSPLWVGVVEPWLTAPIREELPEASRGMASSSSAPRASATVKIAARPPLSTSTARTTDSSRPWRSANSVAVPQNSRRRVAHNSVA